MNKQEVYRILILLICAQITGKKVSDEVVSKITPEMAKILYSLSKELDFAHVVYASLKELNIPVDQETEKKFKKAHNLAVYRYTLMEYELPGICGALDEAGLEYVLLKGAVIRGMYPKNVIRTSGDIDVLIRKEELEKGIASFEKLGYKRDETEYYHAVTFVSESGIAIELHFTLCDEQSKNLDVVLNDAWKYIKHTKDNSKEFTDEFFLFYAFAHMAYHFVNGGCGIKSLCDIWLIQRKYGITYENIKDMLEKAKIYAFASAVTELAEAVFEHRELSDIQNEILSYIIEGGVYGRMDQKVALKQSQKGKFAYFFERLFLPYRFMKDCYPILRKMPVLLPVFWIVRIFHRLFSKNRGRLISEVYNTANVSKEKEKSVEAIIKHMEL